MNIHIERKITNNLSHTLNDSETESSGDVSNDDPAISHRNTIELTMLSRKPFRRQSTIISEAVVSASAFSDNSEVFVVHHHYRRDRPEYFKHPSGAFTPIASPQLP